MFVMFVMSVGVRSETSTDVVEKCAGSLLHQEFKSKSRKTKIK